MQNSLGHAGQNATTKNIGQSYYSVNCKKVVFFVKLCEICYRKVHNKFKGPLVSIISTILFELVQIDLIVMQSIRNIITIVIYKWIAHLIYCMSKIHMLLILSNTEVVIIAIVINQKICIYGAIDIL